MHVKGARHRRGDDGIRDEHHRHDRHQRRGRPVLAGRGANRTTGIVILIHDRSRPVLAELSSLSFERTVLRRAPIGMIAVHEACYMRQPAMRLDG